YSSLDLDTDGRPHIAFTSCASFDLYYCFRDSSGQWTFETVDDSGEVGLYCCLQLFDGLPRISYYDKTNGHLKYAQKSESGAWLISLVDASPRCGIDTWLAVDPAGVPYISYWDQQNGDLKFAVRQGENWLVETVDSEGSAGYYSSIAVRGWPRISYQGAKGLRYAERINDCWRIYEIEEEGSAAAFTSLAVDSLGNSRISYWRPLSNTLEYIEGVESGTIGGPLRTIAASVGVARLKPSGTWVEVTGAIIVSAGPPAGWHVEESDRSAGIQLKMPHFCWMPSEGDKVRLLGVVETSPLGEIRIQVCDWEVIQPSDVPKAVFVSDAHPLAAGLLVKMAGIVHIADGGIYLGTTRITLAAGWPTPAAGQFVAVAGVLGHPYEGYVLTPRRIEEVMVFDF
ncbi:MAG: hypothetical protein HYX78_05270, partial [Armatimonadetes bacterium]|nr:hypothetical protein [Armatimonadota bacterium]